MGKKWYIRQALRKRGRATARIWKRGEGMDKGEGVRAAEKSREKKLWKKSKNFWKSTWQMENFVVYLKSCRKETASLVLENWTTEKRKKRVWEIIQERNLDNSCAVTNHGDCREIKILFKSKRATELNFKLVLREDNTSHKIQNLESLILAQDERWRRA